MADIVYVDNVNFRRFNRFPTAAVLVVLGVVFSLGLKSSAKGNHVAWTMVVMPDIQNYYTPTGVQILRDKMQWIVDNKDTRNIHVVAGQGDITGGNSHVEWDRMASAYDILNGEVPYTLTTGNHDYEKSNLPADHLGGLINDYFKIADNPLNYSWDGIITTERIPGEIENNYATFQAADGRKILLFSLEWDTRPEVISWADSIASQPHFADFTAVVLTHAYVVEGNVSVVDGSDRTFRSATVGDPIWNGLVKHNDNFEMVFNGHYVDKNDSDPHGLFTTGRQVSIGDAGNAVHEIVFNAQQQPNGGDGYLRLYEFLDDGTTVQARTYSPTLDVWITNDRNEFEFQLTPLFSADFNDDNTVDGTGFLTIQRNYGITNGATFAQGDANKDGKVDQADLHVWNTFFGTSPNALSALVVPEPASGLLFAVSFSLAIIRVRCWRQIFC